MFFNQLTDFSLIFGLCGSYKNFTIFEAIPHFFKGLIEEDNFLTDFFSLML